MDQTFEIYEAVRINGADALREFSFTPTEVSCIQAAVADHIRRFDAQTDADIDAHAKKNPRTSAPSLEDCDFDFNRPLSKADSFPEWTEVNVPKTGIRRIDYAVQGLIQHELEGRLEAIASGKFAE